MVERPFLPLVLSLIFSLITKSNLHTYMFPISHSNVSGREEHFHHHPPFSKGIFTLLPLGPPI